MELELEKSYEPVAEVYEPVAEVLPEYVRSLYSSENPNSLELARELTTYCIDKGLFRSPRVEAVLAGRNRSETFSAEPVAMLSRSALISHIQDRYKNSDEARDNLAIRFIDIKDMKLSNSVESEDGGLYRGADVLINRVCQNINQHINSINSELENTSSGQIVAGRYGGDEIALVFDGVKSPELRQQIYDEITNSKNGVSSLRGLFLRNGDITLENVALKEGFEEITVPEGMLESKIWWNQLSSGLVLTEGEVREIIKERGETDTFGFVENKAKKPNLGGLSEEELIAEGREITKRVISTTKRHPELTKALKLTTSLPYKSLKDAVKNISDFETFIEDAFYDRLLGEHVSTMHDLANHFMENPPSRIHIFDLRGIKELNDMYSMAKGDTAIVEMWKQINKSLNGNMNTGIRIYRRGSTVIVTEDENLLTEEQLGEFEKISKVKVPVRQGFVEPTVVSHTFSFNKMHKPENSKEVRKILDTIFSDTDSKWYVAQIKKFMDKPDIFAGVALDKEKVKTEKTALDDSQFFNLFLFGSNRTEERIARVAETVNKLLESPKSPEEVEKLVIIRNTLLNLEEKPAY